MDFSKIKPLDQKYAETAQKRWDSLIKPQGSLGRLEELICRLAAIQQTPLPDISRKRMVIFAGDHGVVKEGVSAYPQDVTAQMVRNFLRGTAAICILSKQLKMELQVVDVGIHCVIEDRGLVSMRIREGTRNFIDEPAMSPEELDQAIGVGLRIAEHSRDWGIQILAGGDMGIGNTTSASAIYSCLLEIDPDEITGHGAGLDDAGRHHKVEVIRTGLKRWKISSKEPFEILRHFGGYEIAALAGLYLGGAIQSIPVVVDGFICSAAAALAMRISPHCKDYLFFSHTSAEKGYEVFAKEFGVKPILDLGMRLGEGTGAAIAMHILDSGVQLFQKMPTFEQAEVTKRA